jgi:hypothetical protein
MADRTTFPIFSMINDFESKAFHLPEIKAHHRSLYYFLLGVLLHRRGANRFQMALDYGMSGAKIGNHRTYLTTLRELQTHGFISYTAGKNRFSFPVIELHFCRPTASLLHTYCQSIGISTASNIKTEDTEDTEDTKKGEQGALFPLLEVFNQITGRQFKTLPDKAVRQLRKLLKKGFTAEEFETAIRNGFADSRSWQKPESFTPEYITREDKFERYVYAFGGEVATPATPTLTKKEFENLWH